MFGLHKSAIFCHSYFIRAKLEPFYEGETFNFVFLFIYSNNYTKAGRTQKNISPPTRRITVTHLLKKPLRKKMFNYLTRLSKIS